MSSAFAKLADDTRNDTHVLSFACGKIILDFETILCDALEAVKYDEVAATALTYQIVKHLVLEEDLQSPNRFQAEETKRKNIDDFLATILRPLLSENPKKGKGMLILV